jgi:hypothetical protein
MLPLHTLSGVVKDGSSSSSSSSASPDLHLACSAVLPVDALSFGSARGGSFAITVLVAGRIASVTPSGMGMGMGMGMGRGTDLATPLPLHIVYSVLRWLLVALALMVQQVHVGTGRCR